MIAHCSSILVRYFTLLSNIFAPAQVVLRRYSQFVELDREIRYYVHPDPPFHAPLPCVVFDKRFASNMASFLSFMEQIRNFFAGKEQVALVPQLPPKGNKLFTNHMDPAFIEVTDA